MPPLKITRRALIAGSGLTAAGLLAGVPARAQSDGFRVLRATPGGYDGAAPGPVLRMRRGEELKVRLRNELSFGTTIHWHGVRVPNAMDGTALVQSLVAPQATCDYRFTPPDAGTFWYRPVVRIPENRALHGLLIVQETEPPRVDEDIALIIDSADGKVRFNGAAMPDIPVWPRFRYRLRLANAAERIVALRIDGHEATVIAIDGQPAEPFLAREGRLTLVPGNRVELVIDAVMKPNSVAPILARTDSGEEAVARLVYGDSVVAPTASMPRGFAGEPIKPLAPNPLPARMDFRSAVRVDFDPNKGDVGVPISRLFAVKRGRTVQLAIKNAAEHVCAVHVHGHSVRLLDNLDDGWKPFWLDTIPCPPQQTTRVAFVADNPGKWLLHARPIGLDTQTIEWFDVT
jgi:FtsP/CotA-like multicopper oxidase with cupredoxin domain